MTAHQELLKQALEALENPHELDEYNRSIADTAITALREALAQPEQEPVLFIDPSTFAMASAHVGAWKPGHELPGYIPLYTSLPTVQPAKPLTDEQINKIILESQITLVNYCSDDKQTEFARAIETAHGIGGNSHV